MGSRRSPSSAVRPARVGDADGIGRVHVRSWQAAYRGLLPQVYLDDLDPARRGELWRDLIELGPRHRAAVLVADVGGVVVGFADVGPSRDADCGDAGELRAIYLLPEQWGHALGRDLMASALATLAGFGFRQATLWALEGNDRARRFYVAGGWAPDGASKRDDRRGFPVTEVRYRRHVP